MDVPISLIAATESCVPIASTKPLPALPARAALIVALREQVGLLCDRGDQLDYVADSARGLRQFADAGVGLCCLAMY